MSTTPRPPLARRERRGLALLCVALLSLSACGGSNTSVTKPTDPVGGVAAAFDVANAGGVLLKMDLATCLTTGSSLAGASVTGMFGGLAKDQLAKIGITESELNDAWKVTFDGLTTKEVSRTADSAVVHVDVKMTSTIDPTKFRELVKKYSATQGVVPDDATIDAAIKAKLGGQYTMVATVSKDVTVVSQAGGWVACGAEFAAPGVGGPLGSGGQPVPSNPVAASVGVPSFALPSQPPASTPGATGSVSIPNVSGSAVALAAGNGFACALISGGSVKCWGKNDQGQLGDGTGTDSASGVSPSGLGSGVKALSIDAFSSAACAVTAAGAVRCWGSDPRNVGILGNGSLSKSATPIDVVGLGSGATSVAVSTSTACAVMAAGGVKCWGKNDSGQLGNNSTVDSGVPVDVVGLSGVAAVAPGMGYTCVLTAAGGVKCWGRNDFANLGNGSTTGSKTPVDALGLASGVTALDVRGSVPCVLTSAGGVKCWGGDRTIPTDVTGVTSDVRSIIGIAGASTCAILGDGRIMCWNYNFTPTDGTAQLGGIFKSLALGSDGSGRGANITCVLTLGGGVACGGETGWTEIAGLTPGGGSSSSTPPPASGTVAGVSVGSQHTCVVTTSGGARCWGATPGDGTVKSTAPVDVYGLASGVKAVATGAFFSCALTTAGGVKCWGGTASGELGNGTTGNSTVPVDVTGLGSGVTAIAAGGSQACAVMATGAVMCWGLNLGSTPKTVAGLSGVTGISLGSNNYLCALSAAGGVKCWSAPQSPKDVAGHTSGVGAVDANSACAALVAGGVTCWTGNADLSSLTSPLKAISGSLSSALNVQACALTATGGVKCWGAGALGNGTSSSSTTPVDAIGLSSGVLAISAGGDGACAVAASHALLCWGNSPYSSIPVNTVPTLVSGL